MRLRDETALDPEAVASLDAIDAVLAGEPVDPRHAELAELALLLAGERPEPGVPFATQLDERVQRRFAAPPAQRRPRRFGGLPASQRPRRRWLWGSGWGLAVAGGVAVAIVLSSGSPSRPTAPPTVTSAAGAASSTASSAAPAGARAPASRTTVQPAAASGQAFSAASTSSTVTLQPPSSGRKVVQGGQLSLTTAPSRVDTVAQEVFDVVGQWRGIVNSSTVTATGGPGGYAQFQLSIPSRALAQTMSALSTLQYAGVASRTDTSQDVTDQYNADASRLADARALRTSLLKQLANAATQSQINSLTAQIHDAEASISSDLATLRGLNNQINYSQVTLTINGGPAPVPAQSGGGGFSLHQAADDAGRVLTVAAGVALIALAALLPIALLGGVGWWMAAALRRRRREQALDAI